MRPIDDELTFRCTTCEASAGARPTFHLGLAFCCAGCVANGPCVCSYDEPIDAGPILEDGHGLEADPAIEAVPILARALVAVAG